MERGQFGRSSESFRLPLKIKVHWWKLIHHGMATRLGKLCRKMEKLDICEICGAEDEDDYHAINGGVTMWWRSGVRCEEYGPFSVENHLSNSGPEWLLNVINMYDVDVCACS